MNKATNDLNHGVVHGQYAPGFEPVVTRFVQSFERAQEIGASLCVYHRGEIVVDLWGGLADQAARTPWTADSLIVVFSATKGLTAMALNLAAERGMFDWDTSVAQYWPAFGQAGKQHITVRQLFNHRAGLGGITTPLTPCATVRPGASRLGARGAGAASARMASRYPAGLPRH